MNAHLYPLYSFLWEMITQIQFSKHALTFDIYAFQLYLLLTSHVSSITSAILYLYLFRLAFLLLQ